MGDRPALYIAKRGYKKTLTALKDIHEEESMPKLLCEIGKNTQNGDLLRAYPLCQVSAGYRESLKYLHEAQRKNNKNY